MKSIGNASAECIKGAVFSCPAYWKHLLPAGIRRLRRVSQLTGQYWDILSLTTDGYRRLCKQEKYRRPHGQNITCGILFLPGECHTQFAAHLQAEYAVSYGLSPRDSLTFSSLSEPLLCIRRAIPLRSGGMIEPQEIPLESLPAPAESFLPLLGVWLLESGGNNIMNRNAWRDKHEMSGLRK